MIFPGVDGFVGMGWERFFALIREYAQGRIRRQFSFKKKFNRRWKK
jgi:hypothetical protein